MTADQTQLTEDAIKLADEMWTAYVGESGLGFAPSGTRRILGFAVVSKLARQPKAPVVTAILRRLSQRSLDEALGIYTFAGRARHLPGRSGFVLSRILHTVIAKENDDFVWQEIERFRNEFAELLVRCVAVPSQQNGKTAVAADVHARPWTTTARRSWR